MIKRFISAFLCGLVTVIHLNMAPMPVAANEPDNIKYSNLGMTKLGITVVNTCTEKACTHVDTEVLNKIKDYWHNYNIDITFKFDAIKVNEDFVYVINQTNKMTVMMSLYELKTKYLQGINNDVVWLNTAVMGTTKNTLLGWGDPTTGIAITRWDVGNLLGNDKFVTLINHELAHVFGLLHIKDKKNLMYHRLDKIKDTKLSESQLETIHKNIHTELK